jgi:aromatic ring-cleaving dioxygenase
MCGPFFNLKAKKVPAIESYDIHIYFEKGTDWVKADGLANALIEAIPQAGGPHQVKAGMGPHLLPNVEVTIPPEALSKALTLLQLNNPGLSILVHPHTGDEIQDHTTLANWVGKPVPLKLGTLIPPAALTKKISNPVPRQK